MAASLTRPVRTTIGMVRGWSRAKGWANRSRVSCYSPQRHRVVTVFLFFPTHLRHLKGTFDQVPVKVVAPGFVHSEFYFFSAEFRWFPPLARRCVVILGVQRGFVEYSIAERGWQRTSPTRSTSARTSPRPSSLAELVIAVAVWYTRVLLSLKNLGHNFKYNLKPT